MLDSLVRVSRRVLRVPKAVASPTGIRRHARPPRRGARAANVLQACRRLRYSLLPHDQQRARHGDGARSVNVRVPWRALATASTHTLARARGVPRAPERAERLAARQESCGLIPCVYRRAAGRATGGLTRAVLPAARQSPHPGRRPTPSGSRRSTRGEVHDGVTPDIDATAACPRASREAPRDIAHRREASVADDESPRSIFWVS